MIKLLRLGFYASFLTSLANVAHAQNDRFAFAITNAEGSGQYWTALRRLDLSTNEYSSVLMDGLEKRPVFDAATQKELALPADAQYGTLLQTPFSTGVAAAAYDKKHHRLYYTPMFIDQLRYIDLKSMKVYYVTGQPLTGLGNMHNDESKCITRMVIAPNGDGYAISNDGNTFVKFTTGKDPKITQLGALVDAPSNGSISIHNRCTSYGGDMIADDEGSLFILTARNHAFKVSVKNKVAQHLGAIEGLPQNFTINGAAVNADGSLIVSSAMDGNGSFAVDPRSWKATAYTTSGAFQSSDLANSNYLATRAPAAREAVQVQAPPPMSKAIMAFPNPVTGHSFTLQFRKVPAGDYTIQLTDALGRVVLQKRVVIANEFQNDLVALKPSSTRGVYLIKVMDKGQKGVYEQKVLVR